MKLCFYQFVRAESFWRNGDAALVGVTDGPAESFGESDGAAHGAQFLVNYKLSAMEDHAGVRGKRSDRQDQGVSAGADFFCSLATISVSEASNVAFATIGARSARVEANWGLASVRSGRFFATT